MSVIKYVGPFDAVEVEGFVVRRLQTVEVPSALAAALRGQEDWEQPNSKSAEAANATKNPPPAVDPATIPADDEAADVPPPSNEIHDDPADTSENEG